ncbi:MAG: hypothetical protein ABI467_04325 [Kofleriaceae bacterium]
MGVATGRASPIAPSDLGEVKTPAFGGAAACAVPLPSVAGATDRKLNAAPTAQLETDGIDTSTTRVPALRVAARLRDFGVAHHVCRHHPDDQSNSLPMISDPRRVSPLSMNGTIFDTATNVPIDFSVKTRRNQAAINNSSMPCVARHPQPGESRRSRTTPIMKSHATTILIFAAPASPAKRFLQMYRRSGTKPRFRENTAIVSPLRFHSLRTSRACSSFH